MTKPITPAEAASHKAIVLPDFVIEAFNHMIALSLCNGRAEFKQKDVEKLIVDKALLNYHTVPGYEPQPGEKTPSRASIERLMINQHWLDVEDLYRSVGWRVTYDKPGYNETYDATFTFSRR